MFTSARDRGSYNRNLRCSAQEEFSVEETSLTFESARRANTDPYPRSVLSSGHGNTAGPIREAEALVSSFPASAKPAYYRGIGDELSFSIFSESVLFSNVETSFPPQRTSTDYVIGIGDELTLIRASDATSPASGSVIENDGLIKPTKQYSKAWNNGDQWPRWL